MNEEANWCLQCWEHAPQPSDRRYNSHLCCALPPGHRGDHWMLFSDKRKVGVYVIVARWNDEATQEWWPKDARGAVFTDRLLAFAMDC